MKTYDYEKAARLIAEHNPHRALLGMREDWDWTSVTVWENGRWEVDLSSAPKIAGIAASAWATPQLLMEFSDGSERAFECFIDDGAAPRKSEINALILAATGQSANQTPLEK